jgi:membrane-associated protease RseP (regulator of RpoE activity)
VVGVGLSFDPAQPKALTYNAIEALPVAGSWVGEICARAATSIKSLPEKIPGLWDAITGGERDQQSPVSVVGVSRVNGEFFSARDYPSFFGTLAALNLFIGLFNMLPLLPLDGGHIAIAWFEKIRSRLYAGLRKPEPDRVNVSRLMPLTYVGIAIFGAFTALTVAADIVNPVSIFK